MGHSQTEKARSRERIVAAASRRIRAAGLGGFSIADTMSDAGLTHGGFYSHFDSRSDLIASALELALGESKVAAGAQDSRLTLERIVTSYLSRSHRDSPSSGCAVSALASEVVRADAKTRAVMDAHLKRYIQNISATLDPAVEREVAIPIACMMLGALTLSRVVDDRELSNRLLDEAREYILSIANAKSVKAKAKKKKKS